GARLHAHPLARPLGPLARPRRRPAPHPLHDDRRSRSVLARALQGDLGHDRDRAGLAGAARDGAVFLLRVRRGVGGRAGRDAALPAAGEPGAARGETAGVAMRPSAGGTIRGDTRAALAEGRRLFNAGRFFEAHEVWESAWLLEEAEIKTLLQGLIQIAAGFHQGVDRRNASGCARLLSSG